MAKREADAASTSGNKKRRYVGGPAAARHDLQPGLRGVLLTCDVHAERDAIREAFRLFESLLDDNADATSGSEPIGDGASKATAADALEAELAMLQQQGGSTSAASDQGKTDRPAAPFSIAQTGCNGNVFIRFSNAVPVDPVTLVDRAMAKAKVGGPGSRAPHIVRMVPIQKTISARTPADIGEGAEPLVASAMKPSYAGSYAVAWRRRCNNDIDKMKCIDAIAAVVKKGAPQATVDLANAECGVVAEVIKTTCCLAVLPRWREFFGYNFRTVSGIEAPEKEKGALDKKKS